MASGKIDTMADGLSKMISDIPAMMATPDGVQPDNMDFLTDLQAMIVQKLRDLSISVPTAPGGALLPPPPPDGMPPELAALMAGGPPGGAPSGPLPPLAGGLQRRPGIPNPDDLARLNTP